jgi:putative flippase GtrA
MIKRLFFKYKEIIAYGFFGVCTTVINTAAYMLLFDVLKVPNVASTVIAWVAAVSFAYVTNRRWVFESKASGREAVTKEALKFFEMRAATGVLDVAIMFTAVDLLHGNGDIWKLISNVIVIILNYLASKLIVFKKNE